MKETFGNRLPSFLNLGGDWNSGDAMMKIEITGINEMEEDGFKYWRIEYNLWDFTDDYFNDKPDISAFNCINQDPNQGNYPVSFFFCLVPVKTYLSEACEDNINYEVRDNVIIHKLASHDVIIEYTYDLDSGILSDFRIFKDGEAIYGIGWIRPVTPLIYIIFGSLVFLVAPIMCLIGVIVTAKIIYSSKNKQINKT